jgi:hypothetical protein
MTIRKPQTFSIHSNDTFSKALVLIFLLKKILRDPCYGLNLKSSTKTHMLKDYLPVVVLLRGCETFRRWSLAEGSKVLRGVPLK